MSGALSATEVASGMNQMAAAIGQMISIDAEEMDALLQRCHLAQFRRKEALTLPGEVPHEIFFLVKGILRVVVPDADGTEHTLHFAMENQFIADYSSFILRRPALYSLEALEDLTVVVMPREAVEWGYANLRQGDRLGRLIAEYYFIYQDHRIQNLYARTPKQRYDAITEVFPGLHHRVPQHQIASYLGITPVHLSRLKRADSRKV